MEGFVNSVSDYTPILDEESSLVAEEVAFDSSLVGSEYVERPLILEAQAMTTESAPTTSLPGRTKIENYTVTQTDTVSQIAQKFDVSIKTLADTNNLSSVDKIKPGQQLAIPPTDGIIVTASSGDTVSSLVKKYQGDLNETLKYNSENIQIGQKVVIAEGKIAPPAPPTNRLASARNVVTRDDNSRTAKKLQGAGSANSGYPWGWCTWYAAYRRHVGRQWGNAGNWLNSARRDGYATGSEPAAGAIIVTRESWAGHVGIVEAVSGDSVTISEMNYNGFGVISRRTISRHSGFVKGYIY